MDAVFSYAGRVDSLRPQPVPVRVGGFGGLAGLTAYLREEHMTHVVDATHPFAVQISRHAVAACAEIGVPLAALTRPPWRRRQGDRWQDVRDVAEAVGMLAGMKPRRVLLATGRGNLSDFAYADRHFYLLRLVAPLAAPFAPAHEVIVARGPFRFEDDLALLQAYAIDLVVSKNAGGQPARAKIDAARALDLPMLMIRRPRLPERAEYATPKEVLDWIAHV